MSSSRTHQRPHPIRRPYTGDGIAWPSNSQASSLARTAAPKPEPNSPALFAGPSSAETSFARLSASQATSYSSSPPFMANTLPNSYSFASTGAFAPFTQLVPTSTTSADTAARSATLSSRTTFATTSLGGFNVNLKASESGTEDEVILATSSRVVSASSRAAQHASSLSRLPSPQRSTTYGPASASTLAAPLASCSTPVRPGEPPPAAKQVDKHNSRSPRAVADYAAARATSSAQKAVWNQAPARRPGKDQPSFELDILVRSAPKPASVDAQTAPVLYDELSVRRLATKATSEGGGRGGIATSGQTSSEAGPATQAKVTGKGQALSTERRTVVPPTVIGQKSLPPARGQSTDRASDGSSSSLTTIETSSDGEWTPGRKKATDRQQPSVRARPTPRSGKGAVSYVEPTEHDQTDDFPEESVDTAAEPGSVAKVERDLIFHDGKIGMQDPDLVIASRPSSRKRLQVRVNGARNAANSWVPRPGIPPTVLAGTTRSSAKPRPPRRSISPDPGGATKLPRRTDAVASEQVPNYIPVGTPPVLNGAHEAPIAGPSGAAFGPRFTDAKAGRFGYILQPRYCASYVSTFLDPNRPDLPAVPKCQECISKRSGFVCGFAGVRSFPVDNQGRPLPFPVFFDYTDRDEEPVFPIEYDSPFTIVEANILKTTCADSLLPTLKRELAHSELPRSVRLRRQLGTTYTCDGCAASFLCGSWMCTTCAREYCLDCLEVAKQLPIEAIKEHSKTRRTFHQGLNGSIAGLNVHTVDKLTRCVLTERHGVADLIPVIRMDRLELRRIVDEMTVWRKSHSVPKPLSLPQEWVEKYRFQPDVKENSLAYLRLPGQLVPPVLDAEHPLVDPPQDVVVAGKTTPMPPAPVTTLPPDLQDFARTPLPASLGAFSQSLPDPPTAGDETAAASALLPSYRRVISPSGTVTQHDLFHALWSLGEPLVIDLAPEHYPSLAWTPAFFIDRFGQERCTVGSTRVKQVLRDGTLTDRDRVTTVACFFESFGKVRDGSDVEKIKDWPSARDFKTEYPDLWEDFMAILPAGSTTRRDGVLDIAAHTPASANPPDLGPKGYFSQTSDDRPGGSGSTKLHTVNIMLWASDGPDDGPGVAAWDIYRAEDADLIRDFLYETIAATENLRDAEEARSLHDDPIHAQRFYLDAALRRSLFERKGVRSFRVLQRPGQAVFIPAGCAHQVCNLADCIKVATDFVSIENVSRCWKVTDEFREQTKDKVLWRSDVLQLKTMLLWAWRSAERFNSPGGGSGGSTFANGMI
ncbi:hypothetical protein JCM3774_005395 [Rhodotorula dairenensis]